jgi:hypothetical protein
MKVCIMALRGDIIDGKVLKNLDYSIFAYIM